MSAVGTSNQSAVVGYEIVKGNFATSSPNLPQRIVIIGEANDANQSSFPTGLTEVTSAQQAGQLYGYGSPIHLAMRILRPLQGSGVSGIPTLVAAQAAAGGAQAQVNICTVSGTASASGTHKLVIAGRDNVDGQFYNVNIVKNDSASTIAGKIRDAINAVTSSPYSATASSANVVATAKWAGLTSDQITWTIDTQGNGLGITYSIGIDTNGSGTPDVASSLALFGNEWETIVLNCYDLFTTSVLDTLELVNGHPASDANGSPTGRYSGIIMKPFVALTGSTSSDIGDLSDVTDARKDECTVAVCPAPNSGGLPLEAAANMCVLYAVQANDNPQLDVQGLSYPDMPTPTDIGAMELYTNRDFLIKKGCSTVQLVGNYYRVCDFVTTYHPVGEIPAQFQYVRSLTIDWNVRYDYYLAEQQYVANKVIAGDNDIVSAPGVIKPKQWKQQILSLINDLVSRGLLVDAAFTKASIVVKISTTNPNRLETTFKYKRSGFAHILSTTAVAGFNFGTVN
jgi:phage tail sheath gpL-like